MAVIEPGLQEAVEDLAGALLGARPTFAVPWADADNASPVEDVRAALAAPGRPLTFRAFSGRAVPLKTPDGSLPLWAAGLGGETGEVVAELLGALSLVVASARVQDLAKKIERDGDGEDVHGRTPDRDALLLREAGDVLFYLNHLLARRGLTLEGAAEALLAKLDGMRS